MLSSEATHGAGSAGGSELSRTAIAIFLRMRRAPRTASVIPVVADKPFEPQALDDARKKRGRTRLTELRDADAPARPPPRDVSSVSSAMGARYFPTPAVRPLTMCRCAK